MEHRLCLSCRFFQPIKHNISGLCQHPDRQGPGLAPLVRGAELRCRRGFETDDWAPARITVSLGVDDILLSERPAPIRPFVSVIRIPHSPAEGDQASLD